MLIVLHDMLHCDLQRHRTTIKEQYSSGTYQGYRSYDLHLPSHLQYLFLGIVIESCFLVQFLLILEYFLLYGNVLSVSAFLITAGSSFPYINLSRSYSSLW